MGNYTELVLAVDLDAPVEVRAVLDWLFNRTVLNSTPPPLPEHEFFKTSRFFVFGRCDSAYFAGCPASRFLPSQIRRSELSIRFNLKNYDSEIEKFLDWIHPYVQDEGFAGYYRYEEDEHPTLIYWAKQGWQYRRPVL